MESGRLSPLRATVVALVAAFAFLSACHAHVSLKYPVPATSIDFTDNFRTSGYCGFQVSGNDGSNLWRLPPINTSIVTPLKAGSTVTMSWNQHYPHNGGYELDIHRVENGVLGERVACEKNFGCVDGTQLNASVVLPANVTCELCLVRMQRQALEWGGGYLFRSCAFVSIADDLDDCQGCSGQGTCVEGQCQCNRSPATGFWYGEYCEQEDECDTDADCGEFGVCQDSKAATAPRKQCFCKKGYFGDEFVLPGGTPTRKCTRESTLTLGNYSAWESEYAANRVSTPTGNYTVYWNINEEAGYIEYAMSLLSDAWVSTALRPESIVGAPPPSAPAPAPAAEGEAEGEGEGDAEGEVADGYGEPATEGETEGEAAPATEGEAEGEAAPAAEGEAEGEAAPAAEGEDAPAAEGEAVTAVGEDASAEGEGEAPAGEEAEGEGTGPAGAVCTDFPGSASITTCDQDFTGQQIFATPGEAPAVGGEAEGAAPAPEAEGETVRRMRRSLLDGQLHNESEGEPYVEGEAEGDGEAEGEAESEGGGTAISPPNASMQVPTGDGINPACGAMLTDSGAFPMINLDVVVAMAIDDTFRVYDAFTPSRSRPFADVYFGGRDDIIDAVGEQTTAQDGTPLTLIKFRRPLQSEDSAADYCYLPNVIYRVAYAYGQSSPRGAVFHAPPSSLETGTGLNTNFYQPDALLYHGGGTSAGNYDTRGSWSGVDFYPSAGGACTPSDLAATSSATGRTYECMEALPTGYTLHWSASADTQLVQFAMQANTPAGWVATGFPTNGAAMVGAQVVMGSPGNVKMYRLTGYSPPAGGWPEEPIEGVDPASLAVTRTATDTIVEFDRAAVPGVFALEDAQNLICSFQRTSEVHTVQHSSGTNQAFQWSALGPVDPNACPPRNPSWSLWITHGVLMAAGWGIMIPTGVLVAGTLKDMDPLWFKIHKFGNSFGLMLAIAAWIIALVKFAPLNFGNEGDALGSSHTVIGMIVMILGILQPINAFFRPHPGDKGRQLWNYLHWTVGRVATLGGMANVFIGIFLFRSRDGRCAPSWPIVLYAIWLAVFFSGAVYAFIRKACIEKKKKAEAEGEKPGKEEAVEKA